MGFCSRALIGLLASCGCALALGDELEVLSEVEIQGEVANPDDVSAIAVSGAWALIGGDEGRQVQPLRRLNATKFQAAAPIELRDEGKELDIEGIATDGEHWFAVGSHSLKRESVGADRAYEKNLERIADVDHEKSRDRLFRFELDDDGTASEIESVKLRELLQEDVVLGRFCDVPGKENGVDIEGLAVDGEMLCLGFRGPVLRAGYVAVLHLEFDHPEDYHLAYVNLGGRGIREIAKVEEGFLLIGGPIDQGPGGFELYFWDGLDCLPGEGSPGGEIRSLGTIPTPNETKAEGLAVVGESDEAYEIIVVYDGAAGGGATLLRAAR